MRRDDVRPFLTAPEELVCPSPWTRLVDGSGEPLRDYLPEWDQNTVLQLRCSITTDIDGVCSCVGLPASALSWSIGWQVVETGLVGPPVVRAVTLGTEIDFELMIPPRLSGNTLRLTRRLLLTKPPIARESPLVAHIVGSILWSEEVFLRLAGAGAAFPVEIVDFSKIAKLAKLANAGWYLDLPASVDTPVLGGLLLLINVTDTALVNAVTAPRTTELQQNLIQSMEESLIEQLIRWALSRWDEVSDATDTSVGGVARVLTERVLSEPQEWLTTGVEPMDLRTAIIHGARQIGLGRLIR